MKDVDARVAPLRQLKAACASMRSMLLELEVQHRSGKIDKAQLKQQRWQAVVLLSAMKAGIRDTFLAGDAWKSRVQEQKDVVEAHQLKLQNLLYEKDHLVREIRRCRGFSTKEMDQIEFASGKIPIAVDQDTHRKHLDQLTQELETRKRMMTQVKEVKAKIEVLEASTHRKQGFLDGLRGELDRIEDSTGGLQGYMRTPVSTTLKLQQEASTQLPASLYTLFCELEAYQAASGTATQLQIAIVDAKGLKTASLRVNKRDFPAALLSGGRVNLGNGSEPQPKRLKAPSRSPSIATKRDGAVVNPSRAPSRSPSLGRSRPVESGEIIDAASAVEEEGAIVEKMVIKEMGEVKISMQDDDTNDGVAPEDEGAAAELDLWKCSEKAVLLKLSLAVDDDQKGTETKEFALLFQYFPTAQVVTAECVTPASSVDAKHVLTSLFPGDDGRQLPHHAAAYKFAVGGDQSQGEIVFPVDKTACRPYFWAQWICGLHPLQRAPLSPLAADDIDSSRRRPEPSVRNVMQQLVKRLVVSVQLKSHLALLASGAAHAPVHSSFAGHFPAEIKTKLAGWKEVAHPNSDILDLFTTETTATASTTAVGSQYFRVSFKHEKLQVDGVVTISAEYPVRAPQFRLRHASSTSSDACNVDNALKEIEIEVNTFYNELVATDCDQYLLAHQLRKIQQCVDVVSAGASGNLPRCFGRERRGKDRRPALVVDPVTKEVRHR